MTVSVTVRDVPAEAVDSIARRAGRDGRSAQQYVLRELLAKASKLDREEWYELAERVASLIDADISPDETVTIIRELRESRGV